MATEDTYIRNCRLASMLDCATIMLYVDLGFHVTIQHSVRLYGILAPKRTDERDQQAKDFISSWFKDHRHGSQDKYPFCLLSYKTDSLGRFLGRVECNANHSLNEDLIESQLVTPFGRATFRKTAS